MPKPVNYVHIYLNGPNVKLYVEHIHLSYYFAGSTLFTVDYSSEGDYDSFELE
jgi:hypothetical protein